MKSFALKSGEERKSLWKTDSFSKSGRKIQFATYYASFRTETDGCSFEAMHWICQLSSEMIYEAIEFEKKNQFILKSF